MTQKLKVLAPFDGHLIEELEPAEEREVQEALKNADRLGQSHDGMIPPHERIAILERTANLVEQRAEAFARQAAEEGGKPLLDSRVELDRAVGGIREAARSIMQLVGREIPMNVTDSSRHRMAFSFREPIGLVVAVSAFNHPFNLIVHQVIPAIAVGCPVIIKPALTTPLSCLNLVRCLVEAGLPEHWCQMVLCENELAEKMVIDPRVRLFSFIGSANVGWSLRSKLSAGTRCTLEHGGAAPVIVDSSANLQEMLPLLAKGGYYHAGQVCVSVQRVYVHETIAEEVASGLSELAKRMVVGNPLNETTEVGPLILEREVERVSLWVDEAQAAGGVIHAGGMSISSTCYAPTVIVNPPDDTRVSTQEIFGPVISLYTYQDRLQAIKRANQVPFSFQASVFSKDIDVALDTAKRLNASAVMINDHTAFRVDWMPFAGRKSSGLGVGGILPTMLEMTEEKMLVLRSGVI